MMNLLDMCCIRNEVQESCQEKKAVEITKQMAKHVNKQLASV